MAKRISPQKKVIWLAGPLKWLLSGSAGGPSAAQSPTASKRQLVSLVEHLWRFAARAYEASKLDAKSQDDQDILFLCLAFAVYSEHEGRGAPKRWTSEMRPDLIENVEREKRRLKQLNRRASDQDCCDVLIKKSPYNDMKGVRYRPLTAKALRRQLVFARASKEVTAAAVLREKFLKLMEEGSSRS
ncbi:MAG: hypothetical protein K2Y71_15730 [Xanthobacteraceae bacterium]|nr:hypothetical protein [Xanthobacteraceae bacterium]